MKLGAKPNKVEKGSQLLLYVFHNILRIKIKIFILSNYLKGRLPLSLRLLFPHLP